MKNYQIDKTYLEKEFGVKLVELSHDGDYSTEEESRLFSSGSVVPTGREPDVPINEQDLIYMRYDRSCSSILCDIIIGADHNLLACCGIVSRGIPELTIGDLRSNKLIDLIDDANHSVILNWIALEGPISIAKFVQEKDPTISFDRDYVGICHLCNEVLTRMDVRGVLSRNIDEMVDRVALHRAYLEEIRSDKELVQPYCRYK